jgi:orotidine-5'-phosphate decarboxylase
MAQAGWQTQPQCGTVKSVFSSEHECQPRELGFGNSSVSMNPSDKGFFSQNIIPARQRLIVALDVPSYDEAEKIVNRLGDSVVFYKIGLELLMSGDYFKLAGWLTDKGKLVFADTKMFDIAETIRSAMRQLKKWKIEFVSVHFVNEEALEAAVEEKNGTKVLAVTVLTSLNQADMDAQGFTQPIEDIVCGRAQKAIDLGCDGVISSGMEARQLRNRVRGKFLIVTPGIRPGSNLTVPMDDQKRTTTIENAFKNGADYIVVGRPILKAPDQKAAAEEYQGMIAKLFPE